MRFFSLFFISSDGRSTIGFVWLESPQQGGKFLRFRLQRLGQFPFLDKQKHGSPAPHPASTPALLLFADVLPFYFFKPENSVRRRLFSLGFYRMDVRSPLRFASANETRKPMRRPPQHRVRGFLFFSRKRNAANMMQLAQFQDKEFISNLFCFAT